MKYYAVFILLFISSIKARCQEEAHLPEKMLCSSVFIETPKGSGSGFFIEDDRYIYFATARHVLYDTITINNKHTFKLRTRILKLLFYPRNIVNGNSSTILIDLSGRNDSLILCDEQHDVTVIRIGKEINMSDSVYGIEYFRQIDKDKSTRINPIPTEIFRKYDKTLIGADIYLFGYPSSLWVQNEPQFDLFRPLLRKGILAGKYDKNKTIIIDSPVYFGNSGGPVFEESDTQNSKKVQLIGLVSQYVPFYDEMRSEQTGALNVEVMNSGYAIITPIDYALDLMKKFQ